MADRIGQIKSYVNLNLLSTPQFGVRNGNNYDYPFYKMYNASTAVQSNLVGYNGTSVAGNAWCANGTSLISCIIPQNDNGYAVPYGPIYDSTDGSWLMRSYLPSDISVRKILPGGTMQTYFSITGTIKGMALNKGSSPTHEYFYYCDNSVYPSKIKKVDMINSPTAPVALAWPITSVVCDGNNMVYSASRNSLIFIYKQNGLYGVIEYLNP